MANRLKMAKVNSILTLHQQGWSQRRIAEQLGVHRETVSRYIAQWKAGQAEAPTGSEPSKPATAPTGSGSACEPFREIILDKLAAGLSAQRIYQDLRADHEFSARYPSVRRFVRQLRTTTPIPFRRMESLPGEQAQVDFGRGGQIVTPEGKRRGTWVFRIVLSHSQKGYSEAVYRQTTENFIRSLENAFWHFGGVPKTLVIDNLKAAVVKADWYDPEIHPKLAAFAQHYQTVILPTRAYTHRHKGKIENGIKYVKNNALKARRFKSLAEENQFLDQWCYTPRWSRGIG